MTNSPAPSDRPSRSWKDLRKAAKALVVSVSLVVGGWLGDAALEGATSGVVTFFEDRTSSVFSLVTGASNEEAVGGNLGLEGSTEAELSQLEADKNRLQRENDELEEENDDREEEIEDLEREINQLSKRLEEQDPAGAADQ